MAELRKFLDQEGVGTLWEKIDEKFADAESTLAIFEAIGNELDELAAAQADWNQNDETAKDYIKNRTHYEYEDNGEVVYECNDVQFAKGFEYAIFRFDDQFTLNDSQEYLVQVDDCIVRMTPSETNYKLLDPPYNSTIGRDIYLTTYLLQIHFPVKYNFNLKISTVGAGNVVKQLDEKFISYKPGLKTEEGGEIFNDYEKNRAYRFAHAEGQLTYALSGAAHAEGYKTLAQQFASHAEGYQTAAEGDRSHAEGYQTTAIGNQSHAEGNCTIASEHNQHVQGIYNLTGKYAMAIGNGTSKKRSNAMEVDWSGNAKFSGDVVAYNTSYSLSKIGSDYSLRNHAYTTTGHGLGSETLYGHVKLTDELDLMEWYNHNDLLNAENGTAATPNTVLRVLKEARKPGLIKVRGTNTNISLPASVITPVPMTTVITYSEVYNAESNKTDKFEISDGTEGKDAPAGGIVCPVNGWVIASGYIYFNSTVNQARKGAYLMVWRMDSKTSEEACSQYIYEEKSSQGRATTGSSIIEVASGDIIYLGGRSNVDRICDAQSSTLNVHYIAKDY